MSFIHCSLHSANDCSYLCLDIRPGRCPVLSNPSLGSHQPCTNDEECPGIEKCCASNCTKPLTFGELKEEKKYVV